MEDMKYPMTLPIGTAMVVSTRMILLPKKSEGALHNIFLMKQDIIPMSSLVYWIEPNWTPIVLLKKVLMETLLEKRLGQTTIIL